MKSLFIAALGLSFATAATGAYEQVQAENRGASGLALRMTMQLAERPNVVFSNILQAMELTNVSDLVPLEETFDQFGAHRGYENSVLEKYVFMPPGVIADDGLGGEIVILGARPFSASDGTLMRSFVARMSDRFRGFTQKEARVQSWLSKAGVRIPEPAPSQPIPRSPKEVTAEEWDRENHHWPDPILEAGLKSNSPPTLTSHASSLGSVERSSATTTDTTSGLETTPGTSSRNPRLAMLSVGTLLLLVVAGAWLTKRRG